MSSSSLRIGVNIDHVATMRNARGGKHPDPVRAALEAIAAGADGITAHLREDRRHITDADMAKAAMEGFQEFMVKPENLDKILARLEKTQDFYAQHGIIPSKSPMTDLYATGFLPTR